MSAYRASGKPEAASRRAALLCGLAVLLGGPSAQAQVEDSWVGRDKALHFGVSVGLAGGGYAATSAFTDSRSLRLGLGIFGAFTIGAGKEILDVHGAGRASLRDLSWDLLGSVVGGLIAWGVDGLVSSPPEVAANPLEGGLGLPQQLVSPGDLLQLNHRRRITDPAEGLHDLGFQVGLLKQGLNLRQGSRKGQRAQPGERGFSDAQWMTSALQYELQFLGGGWVLGQPQSIGWVGPGAHGLFRVAQPASKPVRLRNGGCGR